MTILEAVRDFLREAPALENLQIAQLDEEAGAVGLYPTASVPVLREYLDGSAQRQETCCLYLRSPWATGRDPLTLLGELIPWLERQTRLGLAPDLGENRRAMGLTATDTPSVAIMQEDGLAVGQLPLKLIYFTYEED